MTARQRRKLIDRTSQYIVENKWDLTDESLARVEQMKPQLPTSYDSKIDATRKMFNTAKSGSGLLGGATGAAVAAR